MAGRPDGNICRESQTRGGQRDGPYGRTIREDRAVELDGRSGREEQTGGLDGRTRREERMA